MIRYQNAIVNEAIDLPEWKTYDYDKNEDMYLDHEDVLSQDTRHILALNEAPIYVCKHCRCDLFYISRVSYSTVMQCKDCKQEFEVHEG